MLLLQKGRKYYSKLEPHKTKVNLKQISDYVPLYPTRTYQLCAGHLQREGKPELQLGAILQLNGKRSQSHFA